MALSLPCKLDKTDSSLNISCIRRGPLTGSTRIDINRPDGTVSTISTLNREDSLKLANFIIEQNALKANEKTSPTFEVTGHAMVVMCNGNLVKKFTDEDCESDLGSMVTIDAIRKALPEYSSKDYYYVVYPYRDGIAKENTDTIIAACTEYQKALLISGNLRVCRPMTQLTIEGLTNIDNTTISRAVKGSKIFTSYRNYSFEIGIRSLDYPSLFDEGIKIEDETGGDTIISTLGIKVMMNAIIEMEDKANPLSDEAIRTELEKYGYSIKRRTVAKYREKALGIPNSRERCVMP